MSQMTRYICSRCGYASQSRRSVAKHIKRSHHNQDAEPSKDRYGNTSPSYEYRAKIMQYEPDERDGVLARIKRLFGLE